MSPQAFSPDKLSIGVFKIYCGDTYVCTGTLVAGHMVVVTHCLSEDMSKSYRAVNHARSLILSTKNLYLLTEELAFFKVSGVPSPFSKKSLKVLEDPAIVTVFGFGPGLETEPEMMMGFASPEGWCNAPTRDGDCTSPVLNHDGSIVGFWTHGNGTNFGRFEGVTEEMKLKMFEEGDVPLHKGMLFRKRPYSPVH
jgi:hypothetical protein